MAMPEPDRTFSTISAKELLSRIQLLETQVKLCVQNQPLLFQEVSHCKLVEERLKLLERNIDGRLVEIRKRIDRIGSGFGFQCLCPCRVPFAPPSIPTFPTASQPTNYSVNATNAPVRAHKQPPRPCPPTATQPASETLQKKPDQVISNFFKALNLDPIIPGLPPVSPSRAETIEKTGTRARTRTKTFQNRVCPKCGNIFSTHQNMLRHIRLMHAPKLRFQCKFCQRSYNELEGLRDHQRKAHCHIQNEQSQVVTSSRTEEVMACPEESCGLIFTRPRDLLMHVKSSHCQGQGQRRRTTEQRNDTEGEPLDGGTDTDAGHENKNSVTHGESEGLADSLQQNPSESDQEVQQHETNIAKIKPFQCKCCPPSPSRIFEDVQSLANHYTSQHPIPPTLTAGSELLKPKHKLRRRGKAGRSPSKHSYRIHKNWKDGSGRCPECRKYFTNIRSHIKSHKPVPERREHICTTCGKGFVTIQNLQNHEKEVHKGERPLPCKICGNAFGRKSNLKIHLARHNGERPFGCTRCGKKFWKESVLKTHRCIPSEPKQHRHGCDECGMYFPAEAFLTSHKQTSHGKVININIDSNQQA